MRLRSHLETLLAAALDRPDAHVDDLPVMPERERRLVLDDWNATREAYPDACMHELVEAAVERTPEATAVVFPGAPDQTLTYRELNERANRLAHHLRALGVGPDVPVAICLERSLDMAVAVLAVLKAGGAYVPLDPTYPRERLLQMLEDTAAPVVVSHAATRDRLPADRPCAPRLARRGPASDRRAARHESRERRRARQPAVCDLHVGLHRAAEGDRALAPRAGQPRRGGIWRRSPKGAACCSSRRSASTRASTRCSPRGRRAAISR